MGKLAIIGYVVLGVALIGALLNVKDIARYIRISRM